MKLAPLVLTSLLSSCAPLFEPAYGRSVSYAADCYGYICRSAALVRTVRAVKEGDIVEGGRIWPSVSYSGWIISRILPDGVELKPDERSAERVFMPYGGQETVESRHPNPYNFESSLTFERSPAPGTALMTVLEKPY